MAVVRCAGRVITWTRVSAVLLKWLAYGLLIVASVAAGVIVPEAYEFGAAELVMAYGMVAIGLVGAASGGR